MRFSGCIPRECWKIRTTKSHKHIHMHSKCVQQFYGYMNNKSFYKQWKVSLLNKPCWLFIWHLGLCPNGGLGWAAKHWMRRERVCKQHATKLKQSYHNQTANLQLLFLMKWCRELINATIFSSFKVILLRKDKGQSSRNFITVKK